MSPVKNFAKGTSKLSPTKKAPGAPKRFKSSYILFFMHIQDEIKKNLPPGTHTAPVVSKKASELWRKLSAQDRLHWDTEAAKEKERYNAEKELYKGPWLVPHKRAKKDPTAPKRNASAFLLYSVKKRKEIKKINPNLKTTDISRKLGQLWRATSEDEKRPFVEREEIEREEYKQKMHAWKREKEAKESILTVTPTTPTTPTTPHDDADASATESERDSTENDSKQHSEIDAERILGRDMFTTSLAGVPEFSWEGEMQYHIRPRPTTNYCPPSHPPQSHATWWNETNRAHSANRHYNQHFYHHGPEQGYSPSHQYAPPPNHDYQRPIESRSMSSNPRYSPISLYRNDMDPIFGQSGPVFFPSPPMSRNEELDFLEDWKRNKSPSHLASRTSNAMPPKCSNPSSDNLVFKHDPVLDCFPIGSYDELDQSPIDTFQ